VNSIIKTVIQMKKQVVVMVNDKASCNISCTHCYLPFTGKRSPQETLDLVDRLQDDGYEVTIAGSETLMDIGYLAAYERAGQHYILTNGIRLRQEPELFDELQRYGINELRVSLHFGIQKELHSVPKRIVEEVGREAKSRGFTFQINTTITPENYHLVNEMVDYTHGIGADSIKFIKYVKSGSAHEESRNTLSDEERQEFFEFVDQARSRYSRGALGILIHGDFGPRQGTRGEELAMCNEYCPAGVSFFTIAPDNQVYGCPLLMEHPIGKLTERGIEVTLDLNGGNRKKCLTDYLC
jgi:MoaA/NifB/PqqE/SkfB family radical SAM enzyme